jgi:uncharacterized protein (TIGR04255 family)
MQTDHFASPNFDKAPLIEVALSFQFQPLLQFTSAHAGEFWQRIKAEFPNAQEQPPLPSINEFFGRAHSGAGASSFGINFGFPGVRNWFTSSDGTYLLQLQKDRIALNWRKNPSNSIYPRYPTIKDKFITYLQIFRSYVDQSGLGSVTIDMSEVSYINQWPLEVDQNFGDKLGNWLKLAPKNVASLEMEHATISAQYLVRGATNQPVGRLYVSVSPVLAITGQYGVNLELVCRVIPFDLGPNMEFSSLDLAREKVVTTFEQITSDSAQRFWRGEL